MTLTTPPFRRGHVGTFPRSMRAKFEVRIFSHFTPKNLRGHVTLATTLFQKKISRVMSGLSLGACTPNLKIVSLVILELLAFNTQKFTGSRDPGHAPFSKKCSGVMTGLSLGACVPNLKFVSFTIEKQLAFNAQKF